MFHKEREAVIEATSVAKDGINMALIVASIAVAIAAAAVIIAVVRTNS